VLRGKIVGGVQDETVQDFARHRRAGAGHREYDVKKFFGLLLKKNGYVLEPLFRRSSSRHRRAAE